MSLKYWPSIFVLYGMGIEPSSGTGLTMAWKNGEEASGCVTVIVVAPFSVVMLKFATCLGIFQLRRPFSVDSLDDTYIRVMRNPVLPLGYFHLPGI